jgi:phage baseplate assembly protein V
MLQLHRDDQTTSGVGGKEATDHARRLSNIARYGTVAEADYSGQTAGFPAIRVSMQDGAILTDWLPWFTPRAGKDRVWDPPEVGEVVMVLAPSGELGAGVAIPGLFSNGNANGDRAGVHRRTYDDGTVIEYDRQNHTFTVDASASTSEVVFRAKRIRLRTAEISVDAEASGDDLPEATITVKRLIVQAEEQISLSAPEIKLNPGA